MYTNIANYIYDIFETTKKMGLPDLYLGLAQVKAEKAIPEGITDKELRAFISRNYKALVKMFNTMNRDVFVDMVDNLVEGYLAPEESEEA